MSDVGRKDFGDKAKETIKPDSEKSYYEQGKEKVSDEYDKLAGKLQPEENKSTTQSLGDSAQRGKDSAENKGESYSEQAKEYMDSAKSKLNEAVEYVSGKVHGGTDAAEGAAKDSRATK
ncbi:hypothetical protein KAFR_0C03170 [Kazachstania africana CBS 2517]|uniref:Uncharacterized protein n=1 Tax=Kazachstania africana (strain ATCC 22294 / BCRC 22015 / CBS 2517 / CECT 1963 / NBRC 1671 / NRRL Y-8276) TaxID=1071382 RepID=H2ASF9_KAZAF|nr:hypothetical protein KAFR_0C03170 [Kazachstania africana CBS 2517]CCF57309.1 hypothetical protein KAFR_0C03170 [Kazachstania africana CBS 2517]